MPYYEWRGSGVFRDARNDREIEHGEVVELPERIVGNHDFVVVDEPDNPEGEGGESTDAEGETGGSDADDGEEPDYAAMDYQELRELAVDADTDEINGRSSKEKIVAYLSDDE